MNAELAIGLIIGLLVGGAGVGIWMGTIAHTNYEKYRDWKAKALDFESKWLDTLEGNTDRMWLLKADGAADPYVVRGRPDIQHKPSSEVSEDTDTIDLTWAAE